MHVNLNNRGGRMFSTKYLSFMVVFLLLFSLIGCQKTVNEQPKEVKLSGKAVIGAAVAKVGKNLLDIKRPHILYTKEDSAELQILVDAILRAEKIPGIVDVTAPNFVFTLTFEDKTKERYSLWLHKDGGSLMNEKDSNHIYKLPKDLIKELNQIVE